MSQASDVERARKWIEDQIEALGALRNASTRDPVFKQWRQNTLTVIQRVWPGDAVRCERFRRVPFSPPSNRADAKVTREFYERGCAEAMTLLRGLVAEIELEGVPSSSSAPRAASNDIGVAEDDFPTVDLPGGPAPRAAVPTPPSGAPSLHVPPVTPDQEAPSRESVGPAERERTRSARQSGAASRGHGRGAKPGRKPAKPRLKDMLGFGEEEAARERQERQEHQEHRQGPPQLPEMSVGHDLAPPAPPAAQAPSAPPALPAPPAAQAPNADALRMDLPVDPPKMPDLASWIGEELAAMRSAPPDAPEPEAEPEVTVPFATVPFPEIELSDEPITVLPIGEEPVAEEPFEEDEEPAAERSRHRTPAPAVAADAEEDDLAAAYAEDDERIAADAEDDEQAPAAHDADDERAAADAEDDDGAPGEFEVNRAMEDFLRHSPVFSATGRPVGRHRQEPIPTFESPAALAVAALAADVGSLDVPEGQRAGARAALLDLARRIEAHDLSWEAIRDAVLFAMEFPAIGRRVLPLLVPYLDQAA